MSQTVQLKVVHFSKDIPAVSVACGLSERHGGAQVVALTILAALNSQELPIAEDGSMSCLIGDERVRVAAERLGATNAPTWLVTTFEDADAARHVVQVVDASQAVRS